MARARNIKPSFFMNEALVELAFETRLLFIGLWTLADRLGRLEDRPKRIKMELFPADSIDIDKCLSDLERGGLIERYEADHKKIILVTNFARHQRPHHTEKASELPDRDGNYVGDNGELTVNEALVNASDQVKDGECLPDLLIPDSPIDDVLNEEEVQASVKVKINQFDLVKAGVGKQKAAEFLQICKEKRKPLIVTGWALFCKEAKKLGWSPDRAVDECISRSWARLRQEWIVNVQSNARASPKPMNRQEVLEARNKAVGDEWLRKKMEAMKHEGA